ncbi:MAG: hypothetical protein E7066_06230 [Lentimicrobiaceae bacterium]|nr:hypothetical protein [Lentimicrobiaceae bacterium]
MKSLLGNTRKPDLTFHSSGKIDITSSVVSCLRLSAGDTIDIMTDGEEFYLYVKHRAPMASRCKGRVHKSGMYGSHFRAWSVRLCKIILAECNANDIVRLSVGEKITDEKYGNMLPIITKHLL